MRFKVGHFYWREPRFLGGGHFCEYQDAKERILQEQNIFYYCQSHADPVFLYALFGGSQDHVVLLSFYRVRWD